MFLDTRTNLLLIQRVNWMKCFLYIKIASCNNNNKQKDQTWKKNVETFWQVTYIVREAKMLNELTVEVSY